MPRRLRLQYPDAIYHLMARGNGRQDIVRDDIDRDRLLAHLGRAVVRCSWRVYAFAILSNHLHVVLKTPQPNLSRGMQSFLSAYANGWSRRHHFSGHVFQGRYRAELVENESYLWTVTRYVHLNPVRARLAEHPASWTWSSFPGYAHRGRRLEWVAYDELLASWDGAFGGSDPASAYRRYVAAGIAEPPQTPWKQAYNGWILGSKTFVDRVRAIVSAEPGQERRRESRLVRGLTLSHVIDVVCDYYEIERHRVRSAGQWPTGTCGIGLPGEKPDSSDQRGARTDPGIIAPESVPNLTRMFRARLSTDGRVRRDLRTLEDALDVGRSGASK